MPVNKAQHFVSQFNIRQFLADKTHLFCLNKETLTITDREIGNKPGDILNKSYYYTTDTDDFDGDIVRPLEQDMAPICKKIIADPHGDLSKEENHRLIDWFALAMTRSIYFANNLPIAYDSLSDEDKSQIPKTDRALTLKCRRNVYEIVRQDFRSVELSFCNFIAPNDHGYLLTDQPPVVLPYGKIGELSPVMLPLSHKLMATIAPAGGTADFLYSINREVGMLNLLQFGWADRLIYSASLNTLDCIIDIITNNPNGYDSELILKAKEPFFGLGKPKVLNDIWSHPDAAKYI